MTPFNLSAAVFAGCLCLLLNATPSSAAVPHTKTGNIYTRAHSLGSSYKFSPRDGWEMVNISDLAYKYTGPGVIPKASHRAPAIRATPHHHSAGSLARKQPHKSRLPLSEYVPAPKSRISERSASNKEDADPLGLAETLKGVVSGIWKGLKAIGKPEPVTITWYTGHDLLNPSCWSDGSWAPTDQSFVAALTQDGWTTKPKCFEFLELCQSSKKCVFVRVVDTCAGCAKGSKHVDLTKAAFGQLADFAEGILTVQLRGATKPDVWHNELWGPK